MQHRSHAPDSVSMELQFVPSVAAHAPPAAVRGGSNSRYLHLTHPQFHGDTCQILLRTLIFYARSYAGGRSHAFPAKASQQCSVEQQLSLGNVEPERLVTKPILSEGFSWGSLIRSEVRMARENATVPYFYKLPSENALSSFTSLKWVVTFEQRLEGGEYQGKKCELGMCLTFQSGVRKEDRQEMASNSYVEVLHPNVTI